MDYKFVRNVNYCKTDTFAENCVECPSSSKCKDGLIYGCKRGHFLLNNQVCVSRSEKNQLTLNMYWHTLDFLAEHNGRNICAGEGRP